MGMSWRIVCITDGCRVSLKNNQLHLAKNDDAVSIPLQEVNTVIIDSLQVTLSSAVLSALSVNNAIVMMVDAYHLPVALLLPYHTHHRPLNRVQLQIDLKIVTKKRLWARLIRQKILNQGRVIQGLNNVKYSYYECQANKVLSYDSNNREAVVAKQYWRDLFDDFKRHADTFENTLINYGYALIRSMISRSLVAHGFICCLGIKHTNELNAFNLSDDLMEPWRPFIDKMCKDYLTKTLSPSLKEAKLVLLKYFTESIPFNNQDVEWLYAINVYIESFLAVLQKNSVDEIILPVVTG